MNQTQITDLKVHISGEVITPTDALYNDLSKVFVRTASPAVIVRCRSTADVATAIQFAREQQLTLSVRSGGHGFSGLSTNDGGLVIDLSHLNTVEVLDVSRHIVRIGAGARWGDVGKALEPYGLALSSGDTSSVGVGGLTLGGGIGWLVRKVGLAIDSLEAAEVVLADGRTVRASASENPDLFWALRGGGGNFGVVTSFEFRAQPLQGILGGMVLYGVDELKSVLKGWAEAMRRAPEELNSTFIIFPGFGTEAPPMLMVMVCYAGDDELEGNRAIHPLLNLGRVVRQDIQSKPYYKMLEEAVPPPGLKSVAQNGFVKTIDRNVLDAIATSYGRPGTAIVQLRSLGGAVTRVGAEETAFAHRDHEAFVLAASLVPISTPDEDTERIKQKDWQPLQPFAVGAYVNFLTQVDEASTMMVYPSETYTRLAEVKAAYDPENIFNQNANIRPAVRSNS